MIRSCFSWQWDLPAENRGTSHLTASTLLNLIWLHLFGGTYITSRTPTKQEPGNVGFTFLVSPGWRGALERGWSRYWSSDSRTYYLSISTPSSISLVIPPLLGQHLGAQKVRHPLGIRFQVLMGRHLAADSPFTLFLALSAGAALASYAPHPPHHTEIFLIPNCLLLTLFTKVFH